MPETSHDLTGRLAQALDRHRALIMWLGLFGFLLLFAPNFLTVLNITTLLKGASLTAIGAIGFTLIFILGQLDLSIGAVVMLSGMLVIGLQPQLGWTGSMLAGVGAGSAVGLVNGLLVVRARINSFIVTLGTMTIATGLMHLYSGGGSKSIDDFRFADWLETPLVPLLPPIVLITLGLVVGSEFLLRQTVAGRALFVVGGNSETAWLAGLNRDRYLIVGFVLCSTFAAIGGGLFAIGLSSMTSAAVLGMRTLMTVLAAVIIGGTLMSGGRGSILKSYFAVLLLTTLFNGIGCYGLGFEVQMLVNGLILAVVVLYEAYILSRHDLLKGQRPDLIEELEGARFSTATTEEQESTVLKPKNRLLVVAVTITAMVTVVAISTLYFRHIGMSVSAPDAGSHEEVDVFTLRGTDGQPYLWEQTQTRPMRPRPADPRALPETHKGYWWDIEYAGWRGEKQPMPGSPKDGPDGKTVILLKAGDHPYWTAYVRGFRTIADVHGMKVKVFNGNWNIDLQAQQTDQAINERPDLVILAPVDATACTLLLRRIHGAGIPCITSNTIPVHEAMPYCLTWTGPDDWGQFRMLARRLADGLEKEGGYAIVRHMPGSSPYFARTFAPVTELKEYAPRMKLLAMDTANLEAEGTMQLVSAWINRYGDELKGLVLAGDGFTMTGVLEAVKSAGRDDIVIVAAGNSKTGMDSVRAGDALAITYQSAEGDGALAIYTAVRWFKGAELEPVIYLPKHIITQADVEQFMPAQW